jgi:hypothetical protein
LRFDFAGLKIYTGETYAFDSFVSNIFIRPDFNEQGALTTVRFLQKNVKINDTIYLSPPLISYYTLIWTNTRNIYSLPNYDVCTLNQSDNVVCDNQNWKNTTEQLRSFSNISWIAVVDYKMYERVFGKHTIFHTVDYSTELNKTFTQVFSICFPNEQFIKERSDFYNVKYSWGAGFMCYYVYNGSLRH